MLNPFLRKYSGQAIAIVMVVLVVASIIGASIYSRMLKNQQSVVETKESTMAIEQANSILDIFTSGDLASLQTGMAECLAASVDQDPKCEYQGLTSIRVFFQGLQPIVSKTAMTSDNFLDDEKYITDWCDDDTSNNSSLTLRATYADMNDYIDVSVGEVFAINTNGVPIPAGCLVTLGFEGSTASAEVFTIKKVYKEANDVKPYDPVDMLLYCIGDSDEECGSQVAPVGSIERPFLSDSNNQIADIDMAEQIGTYSLYELRVLPLKGDIRVSVVPNSCGNYFFNYRLEAEVKCRGESRAVAVVIPNIHNTGYLPLFDYTIYNGSGLLSPD